jgi:hypothetical protein
MVAVPTNVVKPGARNWERRKTRRQGLGEFPNPTSISSARR